MTQTQRGRKANAEVEMVYFDIMERFRGILNKDGKVDQVSGMGKKRNQVAVMKGDVGYR